MHSRMMLQNCGIGILTIFEKWRI